MNKQSGFIDTIVIIVIALIILGLFNVDIKHALTGPVVKENLSYFWELTVSGINHAWNFATGFIFANWGKVVPTK